MRVVEEIEPNNIDSQVHDLGPLSPQERIILSGQLNSANDTQDWFYIHPTLSGNIIANYSDDHGRPDVLVKYFDASEKVPYNTMLEESDEGIFNYQAQLTLVPASSADDTHLLQGIPQYHQTGAECVPTSTASILAYWDYHGYEKLFGDNAGYDTLRDTGSAANEIAELKQFGVDSFDLMLDYSKEIEAYAASKGYAFSVEKHDFSSAWDILTEEIKAEIGRPVLATVVTSKGEAHQVPVIGYTESAEGKFFHFYDNWDEAESNIETAEWKEWPSWQRYTPLGEVIEAQTWAVDNIYTIHPDMPDQILV